MVDNPAIITIILQCCHCGSEQLVRDGRTANGKQRYWYRACDRSSRANPQTQGYSEEQQEQILAAYEERSSLRGLERVFGVSRKTVSRWLQKKGGARALEHYATGTGTR